jgi:hypothetical protein
LFSHFSSEQDSEGSSAEVASSSCSDTVAYDDRNITAV